jgi:hypothetical protein
MQVGVGVSAVLTSCAGGSGGAGVDWCARCDSVGAVHVVPLAPDLNRVRHADWS